MSIQVKVIKAENRKGLVLAFSEVPPEKLVLRLMEIGFSATIDPDKFKTRFGSHPAYISYANKLKDTLLEGGDYLSVKVTPSYQANQQNIDSYLFSRAKFTYNLNGNREQQSYVIFENYKVAELIAKQFGEEQYGDDFINVEIKRRGSKVAAQQLFENRFYIDSTHVWKSEEDKGDTYIHDQQVSDEADKGQNAESLSISIGVEADKDQKDNILEVDQKYTETESDIEPQSEHIFQEAVTHNEDQKPDKSIESDQQSERTNVGDTADVERTTPEQDDHEGQDNSNKLASRLDELLTPINTIEEGNTVEFSGQTYTEVIYSLYPFGKVFSITQSTGLLLLTTINLKEELMISPLDYLGIHGIEKSKLTPKWWTSKQEKNTKTFKSFTVSKTLQCSESDLAKDIIRYGFEKGIIDKNRVDYQYIMDVSFYSDDVDNIQFEIINDLQDNTNKFPLEELATAYLVEKLLPLGIDSLYIRNERGGEEQYRWDWILLKQAPVQVQGKVEPLPDAIQDSVVKGDDSQSENVSEENIEVSLSDQYTFSYGQIINASQTIDNLTFITTPENSANDHPFSSWPLYYLGTIGIEAKRLEAWEKYSEKSSVEFIPSAESLHVSKILQCNESDLVKAILKYGAEQQLFDTTSLELSKLFSLPYYNPDGRSIAFELQIAEKSEPPVLSVRRLAEAYLQKVLLPAGIDAIHFQNEIDQAVQYQYDWVLLQDLPLLEPVSNAQVLPKVAETDELSSWQYDDQKTKEVTIKAHDADALIPFLLVPKELEEPFISGYVKEMNSKMIEDDLMLTTPSLENYQFSPPIRLYKLVQFDSPFFDGRQLTQMEILYLWFKHGQEWFKLLGLPTAHDHPYINLQQGYLLIKPLSAILQTAYSWADAVKHYRPISNPANALSYLEEQIATYKTALNKTIDSITIKPKAGQEEEHDRLKDVLHRYMKSRKVLTQFVNGTTETLELKEASFTDYLSRVIAAIHQYFYDGQRPTKSKIEKLQAQFDIPTKGMLWEAVELAWLLWYKQIYIDKAMPFEYRLAQMTEFWNKLQPTYDFADSSKMLYRQYSTPGPIAAIIAQYTKMDVAQRIFEPSAGNGLLVLGADPAKTHVNEIDPTRIQSLQHQQFKTVTMHNASQPLPSTLDNWFDVMVTNPPFSSWEETERKKLEIIDRYFDGQESLARYLRLDHVMCAIGLQTLKKTGRAALIILNHQYFDDEGRIKRYRPFFNWLYRHYNVEDIINLNGYKLYNKQGAVTKMMLILINGRKSKPGGVPPTKDRQPEIETMVNSYQELWARVKPHIFTDPKTILLNQLTIELAA